LCFKYQRFLDKKIFRSRINNQGINLNVLEKRNNFHNFNVKLPKSPKFQKNILTDRQNFGENFEKNRRIVIIASIPRVVVRLNHSLAQTAVVRLHDGVPISQLELVPELCRA
jgi:hypothetical protein